MLHALIWIAAGVAFLLLADWLIIHRWITNWGSTAAERQQTLPGDDLVPGPRLAYTQAITIQAPPEAVWPWLMQMGDGKGGLYSYDWLENLMGCNMHSVDRIIPEWQDLKIGDMVKIMPMGGPAVRVMERPHTLLLTTFVDGQMKEYDPAWPRPAARMDQAWLFLLVPLTGGGTRLITRSRIDYAPLSLLNWLMWQGFTAHGSVIMQRKMLLGIKARAERLAGASRAA